MLRVSQFFESILYLSLGAVLLFSGCDSDALEQSASLPTTPDRVSQTASQSSMADETAPLMLAIGDRVQVKEGGANLYDRPNGTIVDFAPEGSAGEVVRIRNGWVEVSFDDSFAASVLLEERIESEGTVPPPNEPPNAAFAYSINGLEASFTDTSTDDGVIVSWTWDLGDGNESLDQHPTHEYAMAGTYAVSLTVTDDEGVSDSVTQNVTVTDAANQPPVADFTFTTIDLQVLFEDLSTDDGSILSWSWDFGDGNSATTQNPSHTFGGPGTYSVELTVTDDVGATDVIIQSVTVFDPDPTASELLVGLFGCSHATGLIEGMNAAKPDLWTPSLDVANRYGGNLLSEYGTLSNREWNDFDAMLAELETAYSASSDPNALIIYQPCARGRTPDSADPTDTEKAYIETIAAEVESRVAGAFDYTFVVIAQPDYDPPGTCRKVGENTPLAMHNLALHAANIGLSDPPYQIGPLSLAAGEIAPDNCHASELGKNREGSEFVFDWLLPTYAE